MHLVASVHMSVHSFACLLACRSKLMVKCKKSCFDITVRSSSKVGIRVKGRGQGQGQRLMLNSWHTAVDIRGSALPRAAKSNRSHYQSRVFVCESAIKGHIRIKACMWSNGF